MSGGDGHERQDGRERAAGHQRDDGAAPPAGADFEAEALPHLEAVYRFALRLSGSAAAAEDLVQETFLRAFRAWHQFTPGTNARSWLFTICRNVFLRERERAQRHDRIVLAETAWDGVISPLWLEPDLDPEHTFFHEVIDETVLEAIDRLPEEYRTAVVLSDLEGLPYAEIARVTDVPVGTVKSRLFRGRRRLQKVLWEHATEAGYVSRRADPEGAAGVDGSGDTGPAATGEAGEEKGP